MKKKLKDQELTIEQLKNKDPYQLYRMYGNVQLIEDLKKEIEYNFFFL